MVPNFSLTKLGVATLVGCALTLLPGCGDSSNPPIFSSVGQASTSSPGDITGPLTQSETGEVYIDTYVDASAGATLTLPNGAQLTMPPGCLTSSQNIHFGYYPQQVPTGGPPTLHDDGQDPGTDGDVFYNVEPSQILATPATLQIPYPLDPNWPGEIPQMCSFSYHNPVAPSSEEDTYFQAEDPLYNFDNNTITLQTNHFSGLDLFSAGEPAYLVMDVPAAQLLPSDILMTFTSKSGIGQQYALGPGPGWVPGHVGVYVGPTFASQTLDTGGDNPQLLFGVADTVEAIPNKVHATTVDYFRTGFHNDHLYLGPRRPKESLSEVDRRKIVSKAPRALGKKYAVLGDAKNQNFSPYELIHGLIDPFSTDQGYSCVGLADVLYLYGAGVNLAPSSNTRLFGAIVPKDIMETTNPVDRVVLPRGEIFSMKFYGAILEPVPGVLRSRIPYTSTRNISGPGFANSYDIEYDNIPPGASITKGGQYDTFYWIPGPNSPTSWTMTVRMRANVNQKLDFTYIRVINLFKKSFGVVNLRDRQHPIVQSLTFDVR